MTDLLEQLGSRRRTTSSSSRPASLWLRDHLVASGHLTETGLARRAWLRPCHGRGCRSLVLAGLDADFAACEAYVDPVPLSTLGEALAVIEGRRTYSLAKAGGGWVLDGRDHHRITFAPAGSRTRLDVVREHRCRSPKLPAALVAPSSFPEVRPPMPIDAVPPF